MDFSKEMQFLKRKAIMLQVGLYATKVFVFFANNKPDANPTVRLR